MQRTILTATIALLPLAFSSCGDKEIRTYKVATDEPALTSMADAEKTPHDHAAHTNAVVWQALTGWEQETPSQFLIAGYKIPGGGRVTVSKLGGDGGGLAANVNRWRGQVGMEPAPEENLGSLPMEIPGSGRQMLLYNLAPESLAADAEGILAAVLPLESETWYFKFTATAGTLREKGASFMEFLRTVRLAGMEDAPSPPPLDSSANEIQVSTPEGWEKSEGSAMRAASFSIKGEDGATADVSVIPLPGASGSVLENVNRWRNQLQLPPIVSAEDPALGTKIKGPSGAYFLSHMTSLEPITDGKHSAISAAILSKPGKTWFFKITGDASLVEANREKFETFVQTVELP